MKKLAFLLFLLPALLFVACQDDDDGGGQQGPEAELSFDGPNDTGPILTAGTYEAAVRFPADFLQEYRGRELESVSFFLGQQPAACELRIYEGSNANDSPANLIYQLDVTSGIAVPSWNRVALDNIIIGEEDLWLSVFLTHNQRQQSIGCDAGPNRANGDWLFFSGDGQWRSFVDRTQENINWNIRGTLK